MRRVLISCSLMWLCPLAQEAAAATQCSEVYPGARIGPPPEWTFWADGSACFVRWAEGSPGDEDKLLERCRSTPGARFVHFERNKDTGQSICIFKVLEMADRDQSAPNPQTASASGDEEKLLEATGSHDQAENDPTSAERVYQGPDPDRLAATLVCSSIKLGSYKHCIGEPKSLGDGQFAFSVKGDCRAGAIAAIAISDAKGRCIRRVTAVPASGHSVAIESAGLPSVLDAIRFQAGVFECYARRHGNISCDGNTDYSDPQASSQIVVNLAAIETPVSKLSKKVTTGSKKRAKLKKPRRKKVVAAGNGSRTTIAQQKPAASREKQKPIKKQEQACFTTIWQCSPG